MIDIPCVIFAGGKSSRMGEDKALLPFGNFKTLTEYQLHKFQKLFKNVYVSCKDKSKFDFEAHFIEDIRVENVYAPTLGFISIFKSLACEKVFIISVDTPFINEDVITQLIASDTKNAYATIAKTPNSTQAMCGIYHRSLEPKFEEMLKTNTHKLAYLLKSVNTTYVEFKDEELFLNLNNKDQYKKALELLNNEA